MCRSAASVLLVLALLGSAGSAQAQVTNNECDLAGEEPNIVVGDIPDIQFWGTVGDTSAFSIATTSCNVGTCWARWFDDTPLHPVIGANMYRLKAGRFEQIGQSWLKHGFFALAEDACSELCLEPAGADFGNYLGVNCSDPYSTGLNGSQGGLGPKSDVNPTSGVFPWPFSTSGQTGNAIYKRLQVKNADIDPAQNPGAIYYVEGQYVTQDDAQAENDDDNASLRQVLISGSPGNWNVSLTGPMYLGKSGPFGWDTVDSSVNLRKMSVAGDGSFFIGSKATNLGNGWWNYEFALHNLNSDRGAGSFKVPLPLGTNVRNVGFHDVDYHSGEPYAGTDWTVTIEPQALTWSTEDHSVNPNANALRWGTIYNFRFEADTPPAVALLTVGLFKPGTPTERTVLADVPRPCDGDGVCEQGETCQNCLADCGFQGGGIGCCGDGTCDAGETFCTCSSDCGFPPPGAIEDSCVNGVDDDCDGLVDCTDLDCCSSGSCSGPDVDGDSYEDCDCNDSNAQIWSRPGEVGTLYLTSGVPGTSLSWSPPIEPGATAVTYDVLRSINPVNFQTSTTCIATGSPATSANDALSPSPGSMFSYAVRATNGCPGTGDGELGKTSSNLLRVGVACP